MRNTRKVGLMLSCAAMVLPLTAMGVQAEPLRIFTFEGYTDQEWVAPFEASTGCEVNVTYTGSVDEMFAKMVGSDGADYDLISIDTSLFPQYIEKGLLQAFDLSQIPNVSNLLPAFQNVEEVVSGSDYYGVPIAWGSIGLIYDTDAFPEAPTSWDALWNPETANRAVILDDANNNIVNAAIVLGFDNPFQLSESEFEAVKQKLIEQKRLILSYYAGFEEGVSVWEVGGANLMFSMGESQLGSLIERGYNVEYIIPDEGGIGWLDTWAMSKGAQNVQCAHQWANYFLGGEVGPAMSAAHGYGNTTAESDGLDYADKLVWLQPVENMQRRVQIWSEVKASQ